MFEVKNRATTALSHPTTQSTVRGNKDFVFYTETQKLARCPFVHLTPKKRGHDGHFYLFFLGADLELRFWFQL